MQKKKQNWKTLVRETKERKKVEDGMKRRKAERRGEMKNGTPGARVNELRTVLRSASPRATATPFARSARIVDTPLTRCPWRVETPSRNDEMSSVGAQLETQSKRRFFVPSKKSPLFSQIWRLLLANLFAYEYVCETWIELRIDFFQK